MVAGLYAFRPSLFSYLATCDLVGFGVEHRVLLGDESVELGLEQVLVDLHDALWRGSISYLSIAVFVLANEKRTQDASRTFPRQSGNPKVHKNSGVIRQQYQRREIRRANWCSRPDGEYGSC